MICVSYYTVRLTNRLPRHKPPGCQREAPPGGPDTSDGGAPVELAAAADGVTNARRRGRHSDVSRSRSSRGGQRRRVDRRRMRSSCLRRGRHSGGGRGWSARGRRRPSERGPLSSRRHRRTERRAAGRPSTAGLTLHSSCRPARDVSPRRGRHRGGGRRGRLTVRRRRDRARQPAATPSRRRGSPGAPRAAAGRSIGGPRPGPRRRRIRRRRRLTDDPPQGSLVRYSDVRSVPERAAEDKTSAAEDRCYLGTTARFPYLKKLVVDSLVVCGERFRDE